MHAGTAMQSLPPEKSSLGLWPLLSKAMNEFYPNNPTRWRSIFQREHLSLPVLTAVFWPTDKSTVHHNLSVTVSLLFCLTPKCSTFWCHKQSAALPALAFLRLNIIYSSENRQVAMNHAGLSITVKLCAAVPSLLQLCPPTSTERRWTCDKNQHKN